MLAAGDTFRARRRAAADLGRAHRLPGVTRPEGSDSAGSLSTRFVEARTRGSAHIADRHGRAAAQQGRSDGRAAKIVRVLKRSTRRRRIPCCWCSTRPPARTPTPRRKSSARWSGHRDRHDQARRHGARWRAGVARREIRHPDPRHRVGETADDLRPFEARAYARSLVGLDRNFRVPTTLSLVGIRYNQNCPSDCVCGPLATRRATDTALQRSPAEPLGAPIKASVAGRDRRRGEITE